MTQLVELKQHKYYSEISKLEVCPKHNLSSASAMTPNIFDYISQNDFLSYLEKTPLTYTTIDGSSKLRTNISKLYSDLYAEDILVCSGAQEAIFATYASLVSNGDEVIVITPCYQSLNHFVQDLDIKFTEVKLLFSESWKLDFDYLESVVTSKTKIISINYPHNPTGAYLTRSEVFQLIKIAKRYDLYILSDEVSSFSIYNNEDFWCLAELYDKAISISVMSKSFGLSGIRIGWVISKNKNILNQIRTSKTYLSICTSRIDEYLCENLLEHANDILKQNNLIIKQNIELLNSILDSRQWISNKAGIVCLIKTRQKIDEFILKLQREHSILVLPSKVFGLDDNFFRLCLGNPNLKNYVNILFS